MIAAVCGPPHWAISWSLARLEQIEAPIAGDPKLSSHPASGLAVYVVSAARSRSLLRIWTIWPRVAKSSTFISFQNMST